jgi:hypothetical protein
MTAFHVGDRFTSKETKEIVQVRWVDPQDRSCAVVFNLSNPFEDETVFAGDFLDHWSLAGERSAVLAA